MTQALNRGMRIPKSLSSFIEGAWEIARKSNQRKRHVSVITRQGLILSAEGNAFEVPDAYSYRGYRSLHSEIHAFMKVNQRDNLSLYNFRFNNQGKLRMAKPCEICMPWCTAVFDNIYYSNDEGNLVKLIKEPNDV